MFSVHESDYGKHALRQSRHPDGRVTSPDAEVISTPDDMCSRPDTGPRHDHETNPHRRNEKTAEPGVRRPRSGRDALQTIVCDGESKLAQVRRYGKKPRLVNPSPTRPFCSRLNSLCQNRTTPSYDVGLQTYMCNYHRSTNGYSTKIEFSVDVTTIEILFRHTEQSLVVDGTSSQTEFDSVDATVIPFEVFPSSASRRRPRTTFSIPKLRQASNPSPSRPRRLLDTPVGRIR